MRLLLDTQVFLWWSRNDARLAGPARDAITDAANDVYLSAASVWEISIKVALRRLRVPEPASMVVERIGIERLPITFEHAEATLALPSLHRDPFDRLLVAQARLEGMTLVTYDPLVRSYPGVAFLPS